MAAALFFTMQATAQTQFATLVHNDTLSSFTGVDALSEAMAAAADGDIITLSSGTFNGCTISKAITLRGAGMEADEQGRQTLVTGNISIKSTSFSMEGVCIPSNSLKVMTIMETLYLNKCVIGTYDYKSTGSNSPKNTVVTNCKINKFTNSGYNGNTKLQFYAYNSFFMTGGLYSGYGDSRYDNCVFGGSMTYGSYYNCIFLAEKPGGQKTTDHCVSSNALTNATDNNNYVVEDVTTLFSNYDAEATWYTRDLTLTDEAKATYLGSDGTEVGIYGGSLPFSPWLDRPFIKRLTVAPKSTRDGKLSVDIEVGDAE